MNMICSMLYGQKMLEIFWLEPVKWIVHTFNPCSTFAMKKKPSEEVLSGLKPTLTYFKVFGCISHVHIHECKRSKLDERTKIVFFFKSPRGETHVSYMIYFLEDYNKHIYSV